MGPCRSCRALGVGCPWGGGGGFRRRLVSAPALPGPAPRPTSWNAVRFRSGSSRAVRWGGVGDWVGGFRPRLAIAPCILGRRPGRLRGTAPASRSGSSRAGLRGPVSVVPGSGSWLPVGRARPRGRNPVNFVGAWQSASVPWARVAVDVVGRARLKVRGGPSRLRRPPVSRSGCGRAGVLWAGAGRAGLWGLGAGGAGAVGWSPVNFVGGWQSDFVPWARGAVDGVERCPFPGPGPFPFGHASKQPALGPRPDQVPHLGSPPWCGRQACFRVRDFGP